MRKRVPSLRRYTRVFDVAIAVACFVGTVAGQGEIVDPRPVVFVFSAVSSVPLAWRRRAPFVVALVCGVGSIGLIAVDGNVDWPYGQLVATYTVAASSPFWARAVVVALTAAGVVYTQQSMDKAPGSLLTSGGFFAVAYALGTAARARRDRIALLEERTRRQAEEQRAAAARERERIARDMHDILAHSISLIAVQAEAGPLLVPVDPDRAVRSFDAISATAHDALAQLRRTLGVLHAGPGDAIPQPDLTGIPTLAERAREAGLAVTVAESGRSRPVPPEVGVAAYRVVQESLTNVIRHGAAGSARVDLHWSAGTLRVEVTDDGRGRSGSSASGSSASGSSASEGHGLIGMRERVTACGGRFDAGGRPGGFGVTATFPVPASVEVTTVHG